MVKGFLFISAALVMSAIASFSASAAEIRILYANDMHSHLELPAEPEVGSYARLKTLVEEMRSGGKRAGKGVLTLNAGDFLEGSRWYFAKQGLNSLQVFNRFQWDAVVLGNHDWLPGCRGLERLFKQEAPAFDLLGANFEIDDPTDTPTLARTLKPFKEMTVNGVKIAILGLTTDSFLYSWYATGARLRSPESVAKELIPDLRKRNDVVIVLSHLGVKADLHLAQNVSGIDMIIGGHSHASLFKPIRVQDPDGKKVPVFQAGSFGKWLGVVDFTFTGKTPIEFTRGKLIPVDASISKDSEIDRQVQVAAQDLKASFLPVQLDDPIGYIPERVITDPKKVSIIDEWIADGIRNAAGADLGLTSPSIDGAGVPAGVLTLANVLDVFPREFNFASSSGLKIYVVEISGLFLSLLKSKSEEMGFPVVLKGSSSNELNWYRDYRVAMPESLALGLTLSKLPIQGLVISVKNTGIPVWNAVTQEIMRTSARRD